jgi:hypothetical protein
VKVGPLNSHFATKVHPDRLPLCPRRQIATQGHSEDIPRRSGRLPLPGAAARSKKPTVAPHTFRIDYLRDRSVKTPPSPSGSGQLTTPPRCCKSFAQNEGGPDDRPGIGGLGKELGDCDLGERIFCFFSPFSVFFAFLRTPFFSDRHISLSLARHRNSTSQSAAIERFFAFLAIFFNRPPWRAIFFHFFLIVHLGERKKIIYAPRLSGTPVCRMDRMAYDATLVCAARGRAAAERRTTPPGGEGRSCPGAA